MEKFPFLKFDDLYINKYGREIKMLNKYWVGEQYCIKLKQSDRRGFSARSTGAIDNRGLPTRSFKSKAHLEQHSTSCIRFRNLNPYIVIYKINLVNCWDILLLRIISSRAQYNTRKVQRLSKAQHKRKTYVNKRVEYTSSEVEVQGSLYLVIEYRDDDIV